jgi:hypothetical protein
MNTRTDHEFTPYIIDAKGMCVFKSNRTHEFGSVYQWQRRVTNACTADKAIERLSFGSPERASPAEWTRRTQLRRVRQRAGAFGTCR